MKTLNNKRYAFHQLLRALEEKQITIQSFQMILKKILDDDESYKILLFIVNKVHHNTPLKNYKITLEEVKEFTEIILFLKFLENEYPHPNKNHRNYRSHWDCLRLKSCKLCGHESYLIESKKISLAEASNYH